MLGVIKMYESLIARSKDILIDGLINNVSEKETQTLLCMGNVEYQTFKKMTLSKYKDRFIKSE